jgi:hypothetical protein
MSLDRNSKLAIAVKTDNVDRFISYLKGEQLPADLLMYVKDKPNIINHIAKMNYTNNILNMLGNNTLLIHLYALAGDLANIDSVYLNDEKSLEKTTTSGEDALFWASYGGKFNAVDKLLELIFSIKKIKDKFPAKASAVDIQRLEGALESITKGGEARIASLPSLQAVLTYDILIAYLRLHPAPNAVQVEKYQTAKQQQINNLLKIHDDFSEVVAKDNVDLFKILVEAGKRIPTDFWQSLLECPKVIRYITENENVLLKLGNGIQKIHLYALAGDAKKIDRILEVDAELKLLEAQTTSGETPIFWAAYGGQFVIVDKLLELMLGVEDIQPEFALNASAGDIQRLECALENIVNGGKASVSMLEPVHAILLYEKLIAYLLLHPAANALKITELENDQYKLLPFIKINKIDGLYSLSENDRIKIFNINEKLARKKALESVRSNINSGNLNEALVILQGLIAESNVPLVNESFYRLEEIRIYLQLKLYDDALRLLALGIGKLNKYIENNNSAEAVSLREEFAAVNLATQEDILEHVKYIVNSGNVDEALKILKSASESSIISLTSEFVFRLEEIRIFYQLQRYGAAESRISTVLEKLKQCIESNNSPEMMALQDEFVAISLSIKIELASKLEQAAKRCGLTCDYTAGANKYSFLDAIFNQLHAVTELGKDAIALRLERHLKKNFNYYLQSQPAGASDFAVEQRLDGLAREFNVSIIEICAQQDEIKFRARVPKDSAGQLYIGRAKDGLYFGLQRTDDNLDERIAKSLTEITIEVISRSSFTVGKSFYEGDLKDLNKVAASVNSQAFFQDPSFLQRAGHLMPSIKPNNQKPAESKPARR